MLSLQYNNAKAKWHCFFNPDVDEASAICPAIDANIQYAAVDASISPSPPLLPPATNLGKVLQRIPHSFSTNVPLGLKTPAGWVLSGGRAQFQLGIATRKICEASTKTKTTPTKCSFHQRNDHHSIKNESNTHLLTLKNSLHMHTSHEQHENERRHV